MNGVYHGYVCSGGDPSPGTTSWDFIRHTSSVDLLHWAVEDMVLRAGPTSTELSACDPSVVYFDAGDGAGPQYYLYYGGGTGKIYVARSTSPDGPFAKYTGAGWSTSGNPLALVSPSNVLRPGNFGANDPGIYGAGEPSMVIKGGTLYMWYYDDTYSITVHETHAFVTTSTDGIHWTTPTLTDVPQADAISPDVKFDPITGLFLYFSIENQLASNSQLAVLTSRDGVHFSSYGVVCGAGCLPPFSSNVGLSGNAQGHLMGYQTLIGFGAPFHPDRSLAECSPPEAQGCWGSWDLWGSIVDLRALPGLAGVLSTPTLDTAQSNSELWPATNATHPQLNGCYSSAYAPSSANPTPYWFAAWVQNWERREINAIDLVARPGAQGFPLQYNVFLTNATNTGWVYQGGFTNQPDASGKVHIKLPSTVVTYGIQIVPTVLGADVYGNHYFQLCGVDLNYVPPQSFAMTSVSAPAGVWDANAILTGGPYACYSSVSAPSAQSPAGFQLSAWMSAAQTINSVTFDARPGFQANHSTPGMAWPSAYAVYLTNAGNTGWVSAGSFTTQPFDSNGLVSVRLPHDYVTWGVRIVPTTLSTDSQGAYYFQLCGVQMVEF